MKQGIFLCFYSLVFAIIVESILITQKTLEYHSTIFLITQKTIECHTAKTKTMRKDLFLNALFRVMMVLTMTTLLLTYTILSDCRTHHMTNHYLQIQTY